MSIVLLQAKVKELELNKNNQTLLKLDSEEEIIDFMNILLKQFHPLAFIHFLYNIDNTITISPEISSKVLKLFRQRGNLTNLKDFRNSFSIEDMKRL